MAHRSPYLRAIIFALLTAASASSFLQAEDIPLSSPSIAALHQSIARLESQREELLTQLKALNAPVPDTSLQDAVALCNAKASAHVDAASQSPLTEDEIIAAITMSVAKLRQAKVPHETQTHFIECLDRILQDRKVRMDAQLELITEMPAADGTALDVWNIRLIIPANNEGQKYAVTVREAFIRVRPVAEKQAGQATGQVADKSDG